MDGVTSHFDLPRSLEAPGLGRHLLTRALEEVSEPALQDILLVLTELVTNSVRHSPAGPERAVEVGLTIDHGMLTLEVCDPGWGIDTDIVPEPRGLEGGGWGLVLVDRLSTRWGVRANDHMCVWAEFDLDDR
jgi:anti-sigma regulatory factor (Ser/Thr protein kinase)